MQQRGTFEEESVFTNPAWSTSQDVDAMDLSPSPFCNGSLQTPNVSVQSWVELGKSLPPLQPLRSKKVRVHKLYVTGEQRLGIDETYNRGTHFECEYTEGDQNKASAKLLQLGLDPESRGHLESRWTTRSSTSWVDSKRTLFQCCCGYDSKSRQLQDETQGLKRSSKDWERRAPYPFTGCHAHVEVIQRISDKVVTWIAGIPDHNDACKSAFLERCPPVPLHEHVYEVALEQLRNGASITAIQDKNREMIAAKLYRDMRAYNPITANVRYFFLPSDHASLYRKATRNIGVDARKLPQYNIDDWLNPQSANYKPEIAEAIFHYSARAEAEDRFELCISTAEMDEAALKYAHHAQMILDGTFGICSSRLLLFIALAVDEDRKGLPIAFFLFSASTKTKATHASYDTGILTRLLQSWKNHLVCKFEAFDPYSCITDTDTKERGALVTVWEHIILLICKFHLRQCWTNNRKKLFKFNDAIYWKDFVRNRLYALEAQLISSVEHSAAEVLVVSERQFLHGIAANYPEGKRAAEAGLAHLDYLGTFWMKLYLWQSWSEWGRIAAAAAIGIAVEGIIPTTNHLESFNALLKRKYIEQHLHSGHRLRFDLLVFLLITQILPQVYCRRRAMQKHRQWLNARFFQSAGGQNLSELQKLLAASKQEHARTLKSICWWPVDANRDSYAQAIIRFRKLGKVLFKDDTQNAFIATCASSKPDAPPYDLQLHRNGEGSCTCLSFYNEGGACKHLRALRVIIDGWVRSGLCGPLYYPPTLVAAQEIKQQLGCSSGSEPLIPPSLSLKNSILTNWADLQASGNDRTAFGEDIDQGAAGPDEDANNAVDEVNEEDIQDELDTTSLALYVNQKTAIDTQIGHRVTQEIDSLLPRLIGLESLLKDALSLPNSHSVGELQQVLASLSSRMSTLQLQTESPSTCTSAAPQSLPEITPNNSKRVRFTERPTLRAPSPELKQKRKASHGTL